MDWYRNRLALRAIAEQFSVGAFEQAADRGAELENSRRDFLVQPLLVVHRS